MKGAKTQASFNLEGQRGKTRSHYLLVKGPEIDVRIGIISVGCCIIHTQAKQPPEPLTTENEVSTEKVSADGHSGDSQELQVSSTNNIQFHSKKHLAQINITIFTNLRSNLP